MSIQINNLRYSWSEAADPLLAIDRFEVQAGERVFIAGPSGSGKTTLLGLIGGVLLPTAGSISIAGTPISGLRGSQRDRFRADHIGFIFQMFNLLPYLSVVDNVLLPLRFSAKRRKRVLERSTTTRAEAVRLLKALGLGDANLLDRTIGQLSVGQQQRVAAARALIGGPAIVVADEPTSALDADARNAFLELLFEECKHLDATLLYVSHDAGMAALFDRTVAMASFKNHGTVSL